MFEAKYSLAALAAVIPVNGCSELDPAYTSNSCRGDHGVSAKFQKSSKGITVTEYDGNKKLVYKGIGIASTTQEAAEQIADFCTRGSTPASYLLPPDSGPVSESRDQNSRIQTLHFAGRTLTAKKQNGNYMQDSHIYIAEGHATPATVRNNLYQVNLQVFKQ